MPTNSNLVAPTSASFDQILADLQNFVRVNSEGGWKDFSVSSAGNVVMELLSGLGVFLHHDVLTARKETILETAQLRSSLMGMAQLMGYPIGRMVAPKIRMTIAVSEQTSIARGQVIGGFRSISITPLQDYSLSAGKDNTVYCALGTWKKRNFSLDIAGDFSKYLLLEPKIENGIYYKPDPRTIIPLITLSSNGIPINLVEYAEQLDPNSCLIKTHMDGVIFVFGDGMFGRRALLTDNYEVNFLISDGLLTALSLSELESGFSTSIGTIKKVELLHPGGNPDPIEKIRIALTKYNAARRRMVTVEDHKALLMSYPGVISANAQPTDSAESGGCCAVDLTCLLDGGAMIDEFTTDQDVLGQDTLYLSSANTVYQSSDIHPSSVILPQTGFSLSLSTGTRVWLTITPTSGDPSDIPQGLTSGEFYYISRVANSQNIRFATDNLKALLGSFQQLSPPISGNPVDCSMDLSIYQDTAKTRDPLSSVNVIYETNVAVSSTIKVSSTLYSLVQTGDSILVSYSNGSNPPSNLIDSKFYNVIKMSSGGVYRFRFATDSNLAGLGTYVPISEPTNGLNASGSVYLDRLKATYKINISPNMVTFANPEGDPGYIDLASLGGGDTLQSQLSSFPLKVRVSTTTGGTVLPGGLQNGKTYWAFNLSGSRMYFASSKDKDGDATYPTNPIQLASPGSDVVGSVTFDVFYDDASDPIDLTPSQNNVVYESAYLYSSSIDLTSSPFWVNDIGVTIVSGMKVRIYSNGSLTLPNGLDSGGFYYVIAIPGTNRIRFAETQAKAVGAANTSVEYLPLTPPSSGTLGGFLSLDFFLDSSSFLVRSDNLFYNQVGDYLNSVNAGGTSLTGTIKHPYGYPTGTKIKFNYSQNVVGLLPSGLTTGVFYYIIRIPGSTNIGFATARSRAVRGINIPLIEGTVPSGSVLVTVYETPQEDDIRSYLENFRVAGEQLFFVDPIPVTLDIKVNVVIDSSVHTSSITDSIIGILTSYVNKLNSVFVIGDAIKRINDIDGVLRVYLERPLSDRYLAFNEYLVLPSNIRSQDHIQLYIGDSSFVDISSTTTSTTPGYV